jgi:cytochrome c biogenesis protein CcmG/thiol:disulfide interchange protein DsbE
MKRLPYLLPGAVFAVLVSYFAVGLTKDPRLIPSALIDQPVPTFTLPAIDGMASKGLATADFKGKISVVNVFASWCLPCRVEHPLIERLAAMKIATVYGLNYKDAPADARQWLSKLGNPYAAIGADRSGRVGIDWGVYGVPETFVVDASGRIRHKLVGPVTPKVLENTLIPLIKSLSK